MRRAWVVLLASCGFKGQAKQVDPDGNVDPIVDADPNPGPDTDPRASCWRHTDGFAAAACATGLRDLIDVTGNVHLDTDAGTSGSSDVRCAPIDNPSICAITARTIRINSGAILSAHGNRPLALLAHSIDILGTLDVASHIGSPHGPGALPSGCNSGPEATRAGGGAGGTYSGDGGDGGEQGGAINTAGHHGSSISSNVLRGGCDGGRGGNGDSSGGPAGTGGAGGGGVWISVDTGTLTLGPNATINASGAGGLGGSFGTHGGYGGGSGGLIVLQSPTISYDPAAKIFANGGGGGGGSQGITAGTNGADPTTPASGGSGGAGGPVSIATPTGLPTGPSANLSVVLSPVPAAALSAVPAAALSAASFPGGGGPGYPDPSPKGAAGESVVPGGGGGGGGGGPGVILLFSNTAISGPNISPPPSS